VDAILTAPAAGSRWDYRTVTDCWLLSLIQRKHQAQPRNAVTRP